jgi:hypothetical protein
MMYGLARLLQLVGLVLVPLAVAGNLAEIAGAENRLDLRASLVLAGIGIGLFYLGWLLQQRVKPK